VRSEDGSYTLPPEYKLRTFHDTVAAVEALERTGLEAGARRYYTPNCDELFGTLWAEKYPDRT
jgi:hypothetical protein